MTAKNHDNQVDEPDNPSTEDDTKNSGNNFSVHNSRNDSANPCSNGYNRKDNAYKSVEPEIIFSFSHVSYLLYINYTYIVAQLFISVLVKSYLT